MTAESPNPRYHKDGTGLHPNWRFALRWPLRYLWFVSPRWFKTLRFRVQRWTLRRLYYRFSMRHWEHPSNGHWRAMRRGSGCSGHAPGTKRLDLRSGERCLWCGAYNSGEGEILSKAASQ